MIKKESNKLMKRTEKYEYQTNINNLIQLLRVNLAKLLNIKTEIKKLVTKIVKKASKNKESIRPNRLYEKWNVYIKKPASLKYRTDGKRNPYYKN